MPTIKKVQTLLDEVQQEYTKRYEWGDEDYECRSLFFKIRREIEKNIISAFNKENALSIEEILSIVLEFSEKWENSPTDCDDTDGRIHINSIYSKLQEKLLETKEEEEEEKKEETILNTIEEERESSYFPKNFITYYIIFIMALFLFYILIIG